MKTKIKAAQLGCGQLGKPWLHYISSLDDWSVDLFKTTDDFNAKDYDCVFLAVRDSSLTGLISELKDQKADLIHFSGALYFEDAFGLHPVYSFPKDTDDVDLKSLDWVIDTLNLPDHLRGLLGESVYMIQPEKKVAYHNYLSVSSNMSQLLSHLMGEAFKKQTKLPSKLLKALLLQSLESEKEFGSKSFSGPWVRDEKKAQDQRIEELKDSFLSLENKHFNRLIEVYNEHHKV